MFKKDIRTYFRVAHKCRSDAAIARKIGKTRQAVSNWGRVVPKNVAFEMHVLSNGQIPLRPEHYKTSEVGLVA